MPISKDNSIRKNVTILVNEPVGKSRMRAIATIAKKHNISREEAKFKQAITIARSQYRKK